jgi:hypothetical protein
VLVLVVLVFVCVSLFLNRKLSSNLSFVLSKVICVSNLLIVPK